MNALAPSRLCCLITLAAFLPVLAAPPPRAQATLVADINPGPEDSFSPYLAEPPPYIVEFDGALFFRADDGTHGAELWRADGTAASPTLVRDVYPGPEGSGAAVLGVYEGLLYFAADDGTHGRELWRTDGTAAGTVLVKDINPGSGPGGPGVYDTFIEMGGLVYFTADDGVHGQELWRSDGTEAGTALVKDVYPGLEGSSAGQGYPSLTLFDGLLYFSARSDTYVGGLWRTDGTEEGTVLVRGFDPVSSFSPFPSSLTLFDGALYFTADDSPYGAELWRSDGTAAGTVLVKDIRPGTDAGSPTYLTPLDGALYFRASDGVHGAELWRSDGTAAGTVLVRDIYPGPVASLLGLIALDGTLFFAADDGVHGRELWRSDGTEAGTVLVRDINSGPDGSTMYTSNILTAFDGALYLAGRDGEHGMELWRSDGTEAGTVLAADINPGPGDSEPQALAVFDGALYFFADDGMHGIEPWRLEGTGTPAEPGAVERALALTAAPNPARGGATLTLQLREAGVVTVAVYDLLGREVGVLHDGPLAAGAHALRFDAAGLPGGVYVVRASGLSGAVTRRVTLVR